MGVRNRKSREGTRRIVRMPTSFGGWWLDMIIAVGYSKCGQTSLLPQAYTKEAGILLGG